MLGFSFSADYRKRTEQLEAFRDFIGFISSHIEGYLTPVHRIFSLYENKTLEKIGFLDEIRKSGWNGALERCRGRLLLNEKEISDLGAFFSSLGGFDSASAVKHCAYFEKILGERSRAAREELPSRTKLCRSLGFVIGVMLAVLFI